MCPAAAKLRVHVDSCLTECHGKDAKEFIVTFSALSQAWQRHHGKGLGGGMLLSTGFDCWADFVGACYPLLQPLRSDADGNPHISAWARGLPSQSSDYHSFRYPSNRWMFEGSSSQDPSDHTEPQQTEPVTVRDAASMHTDSGCHHPTAPSAWHQHQRMLDAEARQVQSRNREVSGANRLMLDVNSGKAAQFVELGGMKLSREDRLRRVTTTLPDFCQPCADQTGTGLTSPPTTRKLHTARRMDPALSSLPSSKLLLWPDDDGECACACVLVLNSGWLDGGCASQQNERSCVYSRGQLYLQAVSSRQQNSVRFHSWICTHPCRNEVPYDESTCGIRLPPSGKSLNCHIFMRNFTLHVKRGMTFPSRIVTMLHTAHYYAPWIATVTWTPLKSRHTVRKHTAPFLANSCRRRCPWMCWQHLEAEALARTETGCQRRRACLLWTRRHSHARRMHGGRQCNVCLTELMKRTSSSSVCMPSGTMSSKRTATASNSQRFQ